MPPFATGAETFCLTKLYSVKQNRAVDIRFARSARRHRVGTANILAAMADAGEPEFQPAPRPGLSDSFLWFGRDTRGVLLEVVAVERPDCLLVIHAMPVHYRSRRE